jgi:predicted lipoprotein with Yx(FWY)xxD motif
MKLHRAIVALATLLAGAVLSLTPAPARAEEGAKISSKEGVGKFLVDGKGMTLYVFKKDAPGQSNCAGDCLAKWPAYSGAGAAGAGVDAKDFGTITRAEGGKQTTYKGAPLYTFAGDKAAGETKGQGVKEVWFVAAP